MDTSELWQREMQRIAIETDAAEETRQAARLTNTPSAIYKPRIFQDGNAWMAVLGDDLAIGVVGCGDTPAAAFADFDLVWRTKAVTPSSDLRSTRSRTTDEATTDEAARIGEPASLASRQHAVTNEKD